MSIQSHLKTHLSKIIAGIMLIALLTSCNVMFNTDLFGIAAIKNMYTITYVGNGQPSGIPPIDPTIYEADTSVIIANTGSMTDSASSKFGGWNTAGDGSGTTYAPGATLQHITSNTYMNAIWLTFSASTLIGVPPNITEVIIPSTTSMIGSNAFQFCSKLKTIYLPPTVTNIGSAAFSSCPSLSSVTLSNTITSIGNDAFNGCSSLPSITIPASVTSISQNAFINCPKLTDVYMQGSPPTITTIFDASPTLKIHVSAGAYSAFTSSPWNVYNIVTP